MERAAAFTPRSAASVNLPFASFYVIVRRDFRLWQTTGP